MALHHDKPRLDRLGQCFFPDLGISNTPWDWPQFLPQLKISNRGKVKLNAEEVCRVVQLMPFVLTMPRADRVEDWLQPTHFTKTALEDFDERDVKDFIPRLRVAFVLLAESNVAVFADERANDAESLDQLQTAVNAARAALGNLFGSTFARPNTHTSGSHLAEAEKL